MLRIAPVEMTFFWDSELSRECQQRELRGLEQAIHNILSRPKGPCRRVFHAGTKVVRLLL